MSDLTVRIPNSWNDDMVAQSIAQQVEAAVNINFFWYLESWDAGEDPKCCPKCAGVKYLPAQPSEQWFVNTAPILLEKGHASCESAAAMHTAHKRADAFRNLTKTRPLVSALSTPEGQRAVAIVKNAYKIRLEQTGLLYWHVVSFDEGVRHDTTEEMDRA